MTLPTLDPMVKRKKRQPVRGSRVRSLEDRNSAFFSCLTPYPSSLPQLSSPNRLDINNEKEREKEKETVWRWQENG